MFAEDVGLLPNNVFNKMLTAAASHPESFEAYARDLFRSMSKGGTAAFEVIDWFNGGLFDDDSTLPLEKAEIDLLLRSAELDWTWIEPSIFGTLFERGLDPDKRSQQGAHYTDPDTIMKIVQPVVLDPWEHDWATEKKALAAQIEKAKTSRFRGGQEALLHVPRTTAPVSGVGSRPAGLGISFTSLYAA